ncbi:unnamed protein product [Adineta steineri]|uniref:Uncharacterized protein n=1 Tax=Adineta steineri TaxID=433720 RepID=A0A819P583_9BILA|nr:unnamed protein product [Adineta steineri]CAF0960786.1 unnamed protein product [Adineta steineri]CAF3826452.1 unnamed protein product [Adineta steineri]CAF4008255.1 unnamed protein product [Adineta steineri]
MIADVETINIANRIDVQGYLFDNEKKNSLSPNDESNSIQPPDTTNDSNEKHKEPSCWKKFFPPMNSSEIILLGVALFVFVAVTIIVSAVYFTWRKTGSTTSSTSVVSSGAYVFNQCTEKYQPLTTLLFITNQDIFDYRQYSFIYQASVISAKINILFGFQHQSDFWGLDDVVVTDMYTNDGVALNSDGSFELNNLTKSYTQCNLNSGTVLAQILGDFPHLGDCYYSDGSPDGMIYLIQTFPIVGGRNYNVSFWLQNNGAQPNLAVAFISSQAIY